MKYYSHTIKENFPFVDGDGYLNQYKETIYNIQRHILRKKIAVEPFMDAQESVQRVRDYLKNEILTPLVTQVFYKLKIQEALTEL